MIKNILTASIFALSLAGTAMASDGYDPLNNHSPVVKYDPHFTVKQYPLDTHVYFEAEGHEEHPSDAE